MNNEIQKPLIAAPVVPSRSQGLLSAYVSLTKPRIIALLLLVTVAVMLMAGGKPSPLLMLSTLAGGALMSGAANALNCWLDRDIDALMTRTRNRPLVTGAIQPAHALLFGVSMAAASLAIFIVGANLLSGLLALGGLLVYVLVYTPAKRRTPASVVIGAIAGASPPLVAWAAVTGSVNVDALLLFAIMASWQVPHTLALTVMLYNDYARARVPVSPVAHGLHATRREIFAYSLWLWMLSLVPVILGLFGWLYATGALLLGGQFALLALSLLPGRHSPAVRADARLYKYSLLYLALLFTLMTVDRLLRARWGI